MTTRSRQALLALTLTLLAAAILLRFPPARYGFYPRCPVYAWTHLQCPGCGATRAMAALLRGHVGEALHDNALVVLLAPFLLAYAWRCFTETWQNEERRWASPPRWLLGAGLAVAAVFTVARNLHGLRP